MKNFMDEDFMLQNWTAKKLYHGFAEDMPIIDYHCHLPPNEIAEDKNFDNLGEVWLGGDHYKWRAMRTNGVDEKYCTGDASDWEKFQKWAQTMPYLMRNPLYHWSHLELKHVLGIDQILNPDTAEQIYNEAAEKLRSKDFSVRNLLRKSNVETVCTTDDPVDTLEYHQKIREDGFEKNVFPTWRPDNAMKVENPETYNAYMDKLGKAANLDIIKFQDLIDALRKRHDFFHQQGGRLSDHGIETMFAEPYTEEEVANIFQKVRQNKSLNQEEINKFKTAILYELALMDHEKGWAQQYHVGAMRNNNTKMFHRLGADIGFDSIGDYNIAQPMARFFDWLAQEDKLTKTIIYNLNPSDNAIMGTMIGNFQDGTIPGKMQWGAAWWFLDQKEGITEHINKLSRLGLLSRFIGMLTDSRSFLSFPRHEYFRRILCNIIGEDAENGELPNDIDSLGQMVQDICYFNAKNYFNFPE